MDYYDLDGHPMSRLDTGYAAVSREYDGSGRIISEKYTDVLGVPVISAMGYAGCSREYDGSNHITAERYYDAQGNAINNTDGFAEWSRTYDDSGNIVEEAFFDERGNKLDIKGQIMQAPAMDLLERARKESVVNAVGVGYRWNDDGSCTVSGEAHGPSWNSLVEGNKPFYLLSGETYRVQYSSEDVYLRIDFNVDAISNSNINSLFTLEDVEFTVPRTCGAVIIRLCVAPGTTVNETVHPRIYVKSSI